MPYNQLGIWVWKEHIGIDVDCLYHHSLFGSPSSKQYLLKDDCVVKNLSYLAAHAESYPDI